jgi:hypothetical protein
MDIMNNNGNIERSLEKNLSLNQNQKEILQFFKGVNADAYKLYKDGLAALYSKSFCSNEIAVAAYFYQLLELLTKSDKIPRKMSKYDDKKEIRKQNLLDFAKKYKAKIDDYSLNNIVTGIMPKLNKWRHYNNQNNNQNNNQITTRNKQLTIEYENINEQQTNFQKGSSGKI